MMARWAPSPRFGKYLPTVSSMPMYPRVTARPSTAVDTALVTLHWCLGVWSKSALTLPVFTRQPKRTTQKVSWSLWLW